MRRAGSFCGSALAMLLMHQARLRFKPSRCTSFGSVRSVTMAASEQGLWLIAIDVGKKPVKPDCELSPRHHAAHQIAFHQRR